MVAERAKNCWRLEQAGLSCAMDSNANRRLENELLALWLAPIVSTLPLIPFFTLRFSPLFLGTLMADRGPTTWPWIGPVVSAAGVVFDGTILGYAALFVVGLPVYLILRKLNHLSPVHIVLLGAIAGIIASQFVAYVVQHRGPFKQPGLTEFALSWSSFLLGGLSGGVAGWFVAHLSGYRKQFETTRVFLAFLLPIGAEILCAFVIVASAQAWKAQ